MHDVYVARGGAPVLRGVDLAVPAGTIAAVLGPSGTGKSTLLRAIAGLEEVARGRILLDGEDLTDLPVGARGASMVFQGAPLHPGMDVSGNLALPLRFHGVAAEEIDRRVGAEARAFALSRFLERLPRQLSTGERQATATARSLVRAPRLLLLDEPLAGLDERTRAEAMRQLVTVQSGYGVTTVLVSNDQRVAASLAEHVVVLRSGEVVQAGPFPELFDAPASTFVATFVGDPPMNLLPVAVESAGPRVALVHGRFRRRTWDTRLGDGRGPYVLGVRPEHLERVAPDDADVVGRVRLVEMLGPDGILHVDIGGREDLRVRLRRPLPRRGDRLALRASRLRLFAADGSAIGDVR